MKDTKPPAPTQTKEPLPVPAPPAQDPEAEQILLIDENALDKECVKLPTQYIQWATKAADRKARVDELKNGMELVEAQLKQQIRSNPGDFGLEKVTEGALCELLLTQPDYQAALKRHNRAKHLYELAQAVVWALEHKKRSLTLLVDLHGMGYFAEPRVSQAGKEAVQNMSKVRSTRRRDDD
jgi:hypothetical protein